MAAIFLGLNVLIRSSHEMSMGMNIPVISSKYQNEMSHWALRNM